MHKITDPAGTRSAFWRARANVEPPRNARQKRGFARSYRRKANPGSTGSNTERLTLGSSPPKLVGQAISLGREFERSGVDAIAQASRWRTVGKNMALVSAASSADDLSADHAVTGIANLSQMATGKRCSETRPASAAIELRTAFEQGQPAETASVSALAFLAQEDTAKRCFLPVIKQQVPLLNAEDRSQPPELVVGRRRKVECDLHQIIHRRSPQDMIPQPVNMQPTRNAATLANTKKWVPREPMA